jgi:hypothetical protein
MAMNAKKMGSLSKSAEQTAKIDNKRRTPVAAVGGQGWAELQEERARLAKAKRWKTVLWLVVAALAVAALFGIACLM